MKQKKLTVILLVLLVVATAVFAQEKPTVVIVPFDTVGVDETEADVLFEVFTSEFAGLGKTRVVDRSSVDKIKAQHQFHFQVKHSLFRIKPYRITIYGRMLQKECSPSNENHRLRDQNNGVH